MSIKILYVDLRTEPGQFVKFALDWQSELTAQMAIESTLGEVRARIINADLSTNKELTIAWNNLSSGEHSNIGGVGSLEWHVPDHSIISILYEGKNVTSENLDQAIQWMLNQESL